MTRGSRHCDAFVLHRQVYRETSALVTFLLDTGHCIKAVVKGVRGTAEHRLHNAWLQPFQPLFIEIRGQRELKAVYNFEPSDQKILLAGQSLLAANYLNEVVLLVLSLHESEPQIFYDYGECLRQLVNLESSTIPLTLRYFEQVLLSSIGYQMAWHLTISGEPIEGQCNYRFEMGEGFIPDPLGDYSGLILLAISAQQWQVTGALGVMRILQQQQIEWLVGRSLRAPSMFEAALLKSAVVEPKTDSLPEG